MNLGHSLMGEPAKSGGIEWLGQLGYINQMVRHSGALLGRWFGRADVHAAINLHGIYGNNFSAQFFGEPQGNLRFADGGRTSQQYRL